MPVGKAQNLLMPIHTSMPGRPISKCCWFLITKARKEASHEEEKVKCLQMPLKRQKKEGNYKFCYPSCTSSCGYGFHCLLAELENKSRKTPEIRSSLFPQLKYSGMHNQDVSTYMVCHGWHWIPCLCILLLRGKLSELYCHVSRLRLPYFNWGSWKIYSGVWYIFQLGYVQHNCQSFCITWFTGTYPLGLLSHVYITGCAEIVGVHTQILSHGKEICLRSVRRSLAKKQNIHG